MSFAARACLLVVACASLLAFGGAASAQPAPITYAGRGAPAPQPARAPASFQTASADTSLIGGGEGSYGYGAQARPRGAVIDLRRPTSGARPVAADGFPDMETTDEPDAAESPSAPSAPVDLRPRAAGQGAAPWLEAERVGPPYEANGRWYAPTPEPGYEQQGQASISADLAAPSVLAAAHPTLPTPSLAQVTNLQTGQEVIVRIVETAPAANNGVIALSRAAADLIGVDAATRVHVRYLGPAPRPAAEARSTPTAPSVVAAQHRPAPVAEPVLSAPGAFMVQIGAFSDLANAHRVRSAVEAAGPVLVDARETARGELFRVRLGPYASREDAEAARRQVAAMGYGEAILAAR